MIYSLGQPVYFAGLVIGFVLGCVAHVATQRFLILRFGGPALRWMLPPTVGARRYFDPFGAVAAALGGVGWGTPLEAASYRRTQRWRAIGLMLTGPLANFVIAVVALLLLVKTASGTAITTPSAGDVLRGHLDVSAAGPTLLAAIAVINLWMAILSLVPLPPLEGARIMFLLAPRTLNWQKAEYYLVDRNIGVAVLVIGLILTLGARPAPIAYLVATIADPIFQALASAFGG
jgi:Zn-dependent protease